MRWKRTRSGARSGLLGVILETWGGWNTARLSDLRNIKRAQCAESRFFSPVETQETGNDTVALLGRLLSFICDYPNGDFVPGEKRLNQQGMALLSE